MPRPRCLYYRDSPAPGETLILPLFCGRTPQRRGTQAEMPSRHCCSPGNRTHTAGASWSERLKSRRARWSVTLHVLFLCRAGPPGTSIRRALDGA
ncbi:hypothetical protein NDU88_005049 [Pleurodeles waltl]|uniref:Uncharacterized protein n=1 Tax=Pleurodeles waltl TaxID=8319 RepID=A0AAV7SKL6_PLEWA|nr:hypothetical protein NDU88_005049 [Pleurodeles waltl]